MSWHTDLPAFSEFYRGTLVASTALFARYDSQMGENMFRAAWRALLVAMRALLEGRGARKRAIDRFVPKVLTSTDVVVVPSEKSHRQLRGLGVQVPIVCIPTPVHCEDVGGTRRDRQDALPDKKVVLYVGRISREKNLGLLFQAFDLLRSDDRDVQLELVGPRSDRHTRRIVDRYVRNANGRILLQLPVPRTSLSQYYCKAAVLVSPSLHETQGLATAEALACGTPAIIVDSELSTSFDTGGLVVARPEAQALAEAIVGCLTRSPLWGIGESVTQESHNAISEVLAMTIEQAALKRASL
jgi:1,2-diacylglycerol 3-alpha-glucosyltransferase